MRHNKAINHLGRKSGHRKALLANMATSLILNIHLEGLCLSYGSLDSLVEDEGSSHVGEESLAMSALATKMIDCFIVPHIA